MHRPLVKIAIAAAALAAGGSIAALASGGSPAPPPPTNAFSNPGQPAADLTSRQVAQLAEAGVENVRLLGARNGFTLFRGSTAAGEACFLSSRFDATETEFGVIACLPADGRFPSERSPMFDISPLLKGPGESLPYVTALVGFASDAVAKAGIIDEAGRLHTIPVIGNVYATPAFLHIAAQAIVGLDSGGRILFREDLAT
jgi:hypothetical protein